MTNIIHADLSYQVIGAAMETHRILGPGFLEAVYQSALAHEFDLRKIPYEREKPLPIFYKRKLIGDYIADFVVEEKIILELKSVSTLNKAHQAQALNYLTATGLKLALLINFGTHSLEYKRIVK